MLSKVFLFLALSSPLSLFGQSYTSVTATQVKNAKDQTLFTGQICFIPNTSLTASGTTSSVKSICGAISNGALTASLQVPNLATATPVNSTYTIEIIDTTNPTNYVAVVYVPTVATVTGASFSWDTFQVAAGTLASGNDIPYIGCLSGAFYLQQDAPVNTNRWTCVNGSWQNGSSGGSGNGAGILSLNGLTAQSQTFANDTNVEIQSLNSTHSIIWNGTLAKTRQFPTTAYTDQNNTFGSGTIQDFSAAAVTKPVVIVNTNPSGSCSNAGAFETNSAGSTGNLFECIAATWQLTSGGGGGGAVLPSGSGMLYDNTGVAALATLDTNYYGPEPYTVGSGGVTAGQLVTTDSSNNAISATSAGFVGIALTTAISGGTTQVASNGIQNCIFDNPTVAGDIAVQSSTTPTNCHDSGTNNLANLTLSTPAIGYIRPVVAMGGTAPVKLVFGTGTGAGGGNTAVQFNANGLLSGDSSNFTYNSATHALTVAGPIASGTSRSVTATGPATFFGAIASSGNPTAPTSGEATLFFNSNSVTQTENSSGSISSTEVEPLSSNSNCLSYIDSSGVQHTTSCGSGGGTPGGTSGQIQYDNAGSFGGLTVSGDATLNTSTGALTVTKTNGTAFATSATTDATNATNIGSGSLSQARLSSNVSCAPYICIGGAKYDSMMYQITPASTYSWTSAGTAGTATTGTNGNLIMTTPAGPEFYYTTGSSSIEIDIAGCLSGESNTSSTDAYCGGGLYDSTNGVVWGGLIHMSTSNNTNMFGWDIEQWKWTWTGSSSSSIVSSNGYAKFPITAGITPTHLKISKAGVYLVLAVSLDGGQTFTTLESNNLNVGTISKVGLVGNNAWWDLLSVVAN